MAILVTIVRDGITIHLYDVTCNYTHTEKTRSLVAWYSGRTLVFDQFTFCHALDLQLMVNHLCG